MTDCFVLMMGGDGVIAGFICGDVWLDGDCLFLSKTSSRHISILNSYQNHTAKPFAPSLPAGKFFVMGRQAYFEQKPLSGFE
ncbi:hypothetical protein [Moraxella nasicaprae]|uniref:Uncharacterized protein n=1 Tax=Moraxella nasicaprae TaxID=2904122 RepID=A0ABY6F3H8_9GAMM|nr:hypothetical protein [Moraxella nasicaprae]UXZ04628.1 hypothetical protein LU297_08640 [Moraxella nasicaprae]